jgi:hypothetical protein
LKYCQRKPDDVKRLAQRAMNKWQKGKPSNFDFLVKLNCYGGRSYNDLSQYPVMPWILCDYRSETIDLSDPCVYRDLTKPIGAIGVTRFEQLRSHFDYSLDDESHFLYGALYSSAAVVIGYLIRLEPFTTLHVTLQSGRFDHPARLFLSIPEAWENVTTMPMDFRELIPEFFTISNFLLNSDHFDLGSLADGQVVNDVILPPWAQNARQFIDINRQALESKHVTSQLHFWVDLIFGPHSRTPLFTEVDNVFHPFFYETALTPETTASPARSAMIREYAACFGNVPAQLFDEVPVRRERFFDLVPHFQWQLISTMESEIMAMATGEHGLIAVHDKLRFTIFQGKTEIAKGRFNFPVPSEIANAKPIVAISRTFALACFPWNSTFSVLAVRAGNCTPMFCCKFHTQPITCLGLCGHSFVSGSRDCTLMLWKVAQGDELGRHKSHLAKGSKPIQFVKMNERLKEAISLSRDGFLVSMSLLDGRYLGGVKLPLSDPSNLEISPNNYIAVCFDGPDSHIIVVLDQNLAFLQTRTLDGCVHCWTTVEINGMDYLLIAKKSLSLVILKLPFLALANWEAQLPFLPSVMVCGKNQPVCYMAYPNGMVTEFPIVDLPP